MEIDTFDDDDDDDEDDSDEKLSPTKSSDISMPRRCRTGNPIWCHDERTPKYSDTSATKDNSFRNHIRQPKRDFPQVSIENRLNRSGCCPLFKDKFYKIVKKHTIKGQKLTKGSDEQLPNWMKGNGKQNEKLMIFTLLY